MPDTLQSVLIGAVAGGLSSAITYLLDTRKESSRPDGRSRIGDPQRAPDTVQEALAAVRRGGPLRARESRDARGAHFSVRQDARVVYAEGGLYLTAASRKPYFGWKKAMQALLDDPDLQRHPDRAIPPEAVDHMVRTLSELHASLSEDLDTRRKTLF